jgi:hypothetical protein
MRNVPRFVTLTSAVTRSNGEMLIFPIIKALYFANGAEVHKLIGTGFFIDSRRFVTARHVFYGRGSAFDLEGASGFAVYCVHAVDQKRRAVARHIDVGSIVTRGDTDIATGLVEVNQFGRADPTICESDLADTGFFRRFTTEPVALGTVIYTVAYPLTTVTETAPNHVHIHAQSDSFAGHVTKHYPKGRDAGLLTWPCYETDMEVRGGASGGPVLIAGSSGVVFAVNCTGTEPHTVSHITSLAPLVANKPVT